MVTAVKAISLPRSHRARALTLLACLALPATLATGCRSGDDEPAADAPAVTEAEASEATEAPEATDAPETTEAAVTTVAEVEAPTENLTDSCVTETAEGIDYFPNKVENLYAENFSVTYHNTYKILTINEPFPGGSAESYVLVQCGTEAPSEVDAPAPVAATIEIPIDGILSSSTTHLPLILDLDRLNDLVGVASMGWVNSEAVIAVADRLVEFAPEGVLDTEAILATGADVLMTQGTDDEAHQVLRDAGLPVVANAEWLEPTPLGRAEWIKYMSTLFNEEAAATERFDAIDAAYGEVAAKMADIADDQRPTVMTGQVYADIYYAAGGQSYVAKLIADAGGNYVWADNTDTGSYEIDLETQLERAADADIWINGSSSWTSLASMVDEEPRYGEFAAQQNGNVWAHNKIVNENGGLDYWERGVTRPDLVLADLAKIFHPDLMEDHEFEWYQQLAP